MSDPSRTARSPALRPRRRDIVVTAALGVVVLAVLGIALQPQHEVSPQPVSLGGA